MNDSNLPGWLTKEELRSTFKKFGKAVKVSRLALIIGGENVELGDNVRIDAFALILASNGWMTVGSNVHLAARTTFLAAGGIMIEDHVGVSFNSSLISASDDL